MFDISDFPTRHPYGLGLWQDRIESILAGWVEELQVAVYRGIEVTGFTQDATGVDIVRSDGQKLRAQYLVGCDGGRSVVRRAAGIAFPGWEPTRSNLIAEVEMTETPELGIHSSALGRHSFGRREYRIVDGKIVYADHGPVQVMVTERQAGATTDPTLADLRARPSWPPAAPTTGPTACAGFGGSPTRRGRRPPTAQAGCWWQAMPRTSIRRMVDRASKRACRTR